jgi:hypothetical protein
MEISQDMDMTTIIVAVLLVLAISIAVMLIASGRVQSSFADIGGIFRTIFG